MGGGGHRSRVAVAPSAFGVLPGFVLGVAVFACSAPAAAEETVAAVASTRTDTAAEAARPTSRTAYADLLAREAASRGLPPALADAVAFVESGYDAGAVGAVGELGLMQVRPATAAMLGHRGPAAELLDPATNVRFGVAYLAKAWRLAGGNLCRTLAKYRAGHGEERLTPRSVEYCRRARDRLAANGSPFAAAPGDAAMARPEDPRAPAPKARAVPPAVALLAGRFWAAHVARIRAVETRTARIMGVADAARASGPSSLVGGPRNAPEGDATRRASARAADGLPPLKRGRGA
jgi:uncharacterized membrane protein